MKGSFLFGSLFLAVAVSVRKANGLQCFVCTHIKVEGETIKDDGDEQQDGQYDHRSCESGHNTKYIQTCDDGGGRYDVSCGKVVVVGNMTVFDGKQLTYTAIMRGCFQSPKEMPETCILDQSPEQLANNTDIPREVKENLEDLPQKSLITVCTCNEDRCNSSSRLTATFGLFFISLVYFFRRFVQMV